MEMLHNQRGVTLIELLIAMAAAGVLMAAAYSVFQAQTSGQNVQRTQLQMQQECRGALLLMTPEIRLAGSDPYRTGIPGVVTAGAGTFHFTEDIGGSPTNINDPDGAIDAPNEDVAFSLQNGSLCRQTTSAGVVSGWQPVVANVDALDFVYLDQWGNVIATPVLAAQLPNIRQVQITIVAHSTPAFVHSYKDTTAYKNQQGTVVYTANDSFRRICVTTTVTCRNLGIQAIPPGEG